MHSCLSGRYEAACLLLVYGVYIVVLCFDLRISEFILRKLSPCCTCLSSGSSDKMETQALIGWNDDTSLRICGRSRTDSGIFHDDSGYSHLSLSLHGLNEISDGIRHFSALQVSVCLVFVFPALIHVKSGSLSVCLHYSRAEKCVFHARERPEEDPLGPVPACDRAAFHDGS